LPVFFVLLTNGIEQGGMGEGFPPSLGGAPEGAGPFGKRCA